MYHCAALIPFVYFSIASDIEDALSNPLGAYGASITLPSNALLLVPGSEPVSVIQHAQGVFDCSKKKTKKTKHKKRQQM